MARESGMNNGMQGDMGRAVKVKIIEYFQIYRNLISNKKVSRKNYARIERFISS